jgi:outer membrane lipase/esterase
MPRNSLRKIIAGLMLSVGLAAASAPASAYSNMYVFGDSLSDSGNVFAATGGSPSAPYWIGRFSNGPTYADNLYGMLVFGALTPSLLGGNNFAFGGATAGAGSEIDPGVPNLAMQVTSFRNLPGAADSNALYVVWAGGNDLRAAAVAAATAAAGGADAATVQGIVGTYIGTALTGVSSAVSNLYAEGARNFLVMNLPNLGLTPESIGAGVSGSATYMSALYNNSFNTVINGLRAGFAGEDIRTLDTFSLLTTVVADPAAFGLNNVSSACMYTPACTPDTFMFWDGIHPTAAGHRLIADAAFDVLAVPEPETYAMMLMGLGLLGFVARRRKQHTA